MSIEEIYEIYQQHFSIQTDTRQLKKNDLFFGLKGPNFNGNKFAGEALEKGAAYVFVDEPISFSDDRIVPTKDVLQTLQQLSRFHRIKLQNLHAGKGIPVIGITGSNGKTTTKELVNKVLSLKFKTYTTEGNLNNHIGVPLTILKIQDDAEMAVIEMGANHLKEIAEYCEYAMPTHGLITNCGKAHLEGFGSVENVKKGKGELFDYLRKHNGAAFINRDDNSLLQLSKGITEVIYYGKKEGKTTGRIIESDPLLEIGIDGVIPFHIKTKLVGAYNLSNVLAAVSIGQYFGIENEQIKDAIENYTPSNSRSQLLQYGTNTIILDAYNANPSSMKSAIENFAGMKADKKVLLLGSMMELGAESDNEHAAIISLIEEYKWDAVVLVGKGFQEVPHNFLNYDQALEAKQWLQRFHPENAHILIKGSRSMQMEKVLE